LRVTRGDLVAVWGFRSPESDGKPGLGLGKAPLSSELPRFGPGCRKGRTRRLQWKLCWLGYACSDGNHCPKWWPL